MRSSRLAFSVLFILALCLQSYLLYAPTDGETSLPTGTDKFIHAGMFGGTVWLAMLAGWRLAPVVFAVYAPISEVLQSTSFVGRDGDWHDAVADLTGVLLAVAIVWIFRRRRSRVGLNNH